eukprot:g1133.t1
MVPREEYATVHGVGSFHSLPGDTGEVDLKSVFHRLCLTMDAQRLLFGKHVRDPRELFDVIDHERTGTITRDELENALERFGLGLSMHQTEAVLHTVDSDHSDTIELPEFLAAFETYASHWKPKHSRKKHNKTLHQEEGHTVGLDIEADASHFARNEGGEDGKDGQAEGEHDSKTRNETKRDEPGPTRNAESALGSTDKFGEKETPSDASSTDARNCGDKDGKVLTKCRESGSEDRADDVSVIMDDSLEQLDVSESVNNINHDKDSDKSNVKNLLRDPVLPNESEIHADFDAVIPSPQIVMPPSDAWKKRHNASKDEFVCEVLFRGRGGEIETWNELDPSVVDEWNSDNTSKLAVEFEDWDAYFSWLNKVNDEENKVEDEEGTETLSNNITRTRDSGDDRQDTYQPPALASSSTYLDRIESSPHAERQSDRHAPNPHLSSASPDSRLKPCVHVARSGSIYVTYEDQPDGSEKKDDTRTWASQQMLRSRMVEEFEFSRSHQLQTPVMGEHATADFFSHFGDQNVHQRPDRKPFAKSSIAQKSVAQENQNQKGSTPPPASTTSPPQDSAEAWLVPPAIDTASLRSELRSELLSKAGEKSDGLDLSQPALAVNAEVKEEKLPFREPELVSEQTMSAISSQVHNILESGIKEKTADLCGFKEEHSSLEEAHHIAHKKLQHDIEEKKALMMEHNRIIQSPVSGEPSDGGHDEHQKRQEQLAQLEEQIRVKEETIVKDASELQKVEIAEHNLTAKMEMYAIETVELESDVKHSIDMLKTDREIHHEKAVEAEKEVSQLEQQLREDEKAKKIAEQAVDEAKHHIAQATMSIQANENESAQTKLVATENLLVAQEELSTAASMLSAIEEDEKKIEETLHSAMAISNEERAHEAKDNAMISEAEQAIMKLKETEDTLQSEVAQNLDLEAQNRDGSDIDEEINSDLDNKEGSKSGNWRDEFEQERASYSLWMEEQKKVVEDMKRAHEAELEAGRVQISEMQDQLAVLEEKRQKEAEKTSLLEDHLGELQAARDGIQHHNNSEVEEQAEDIQKLEAIEAEILLTERELEKENAKVTAIEGAENVLKEGIHQAGDHMHDIETAENIVEVREMELKAEVLHEKQVDIEDAAREAEILESKVDELKAVEDALRVEDALNVEEAMKNDADGANLPPNKMLSVAEEDAADAESAARAIAAAAAKTKELLKFEAEKQSLEAEKQSLEAEKQSLEAERMRIREERQEFLAEIAREREALQLDQVQLNQPILKEDISEREGSFASGGDSVKSLTTMPVMTHNDSDETSTKTDVSEVHAEQNSKSMYEQLQKQSTSRAPSAIVNESTGAFEAQTIHAEMRARIERLESDQLRSRLALLEGQMSFLAADAVQVRGNPTSMNIPSNIDSLNAHDDVLLHQEATKFDTQRIMSEPSKKNELLENEEDTTTPDVASSHSSSGDSHFARIHERIDELEEKVEAVTPVQKHSRKLSETSLKDHTVTLAGHNDAGMFSSTGAEHSNEDISRDGNPSTSATLISNHWAESSLPNITDQNHETDDSSIPHHQKLNVQDHQRQIYSGFQQSGRITSHTPVSVPPSEVSLPGYSIPMHNYSRSMHLHNNQMETAQLPHTYDKSWTSKSVLEDIVQMRLELESSLRASELVRSEAMHAERVAMHETEARVMMEAASLNKSQADKLERSSKSLKEQMGLRTQINKVHEEVEQFMRSIQSRKRVSLNQFDAERATENAVSSDFNTSTGGYMIDTPVVPHLASSISRSGAPSRVHISRRGSVTMEYGGAKDNNAAQVIPPETVLNDPRGNASSQLSGMFKTLSNKLQGMMGTASLRPNDFIGSDLDVSRANLRLLSHSNSNASSPVSNHSIDAEVRANFAEAARLREQASRQERMAIEARERASNMTNNAGLIFEGEMEAHHGNEFAARGSIARGGLERAVSSFASFKRGDVRQGLDLERQKRAQETENHRALQFALAELSRVNEAVASRTTRS